MSQPAKTRFALDLDDLERQLRQTASAQPKAPASDPLAELARIVGQDDPFKSILVEKKSAASPQSIDDLLRADLARHEAAIAERREPNFGPLLVRGGEPEGRIATPRPAVAPASPTPPAAEPQPDPEVLLEEFDQLLRDELRGSVSPAPAPAAAERSPQAADHPKDLLGGEPKSESAIDAGSFRDEFEARPMARDLDEGDGARPGETPFVARPFAAPPAASRPSYAPAPADIYPDPPEEPQEDLRSLEPRQPRKGLMIAAALLGVAVVGVGVMVGLRGFGGAQKAADGGIPVIRAEAGPNKVAPQNPGGVDIPNQNKEIYERAQPATAADTRVVNREEQPIDVQAVARATPRVIPLAPPETPAPQPAEPPAAAAPAQPANGAGAAAPILGEPRRVRTIAVRPDGTIAGAQPAPQPAAPAAAASAPPAEASTAPQRTAALPAAQPAPRPQPQPPVRPQSVSAPAAPPAASPAPAAPAARSEAAASSGPGFMVQLGAPGSEAEARATFLTLQRRFSEQLGGQSPVIRRADVGNGRTVYRLRVGPFSRDEAVERCEALRAAGGQCFIARN